MPTTNFRSRLDEALWREIIDALREVASHVHVVDIRFTDAGDRCVIQLSDGKLIEIRSYVHNGRIATAHSVL